MVRSEDFQEPRLATQRLTSTTGELGLERLRRAYTPIIVAGPGGGKAPPEAGIVQPAGRFAFVPGINYPHHVRGMADFVHYLAAIVHCHPQNGRAEWPA